MRVKVKRWIQSTIGLTSTEANAFMVLLPMLFIVIFSEPLYRWLRHNKTPISVQETVYLDSLVASVEKSKPANSESPMALFDFDPNNATADELISLGIPSSVSRRIIQYRVKGGTFRIKSDLAKMYGLDSSLYRRLIPYITLPEKFEPKEIIKKEAIAIAIQYDLNVADSTDLKSVKGIGSVLAKRIVKYRAGLGGFVQAGQLREVYGLDSMVIRELNHFYVADGFEPQKISINLATEKELDQHPYLSARDARAIVTFRVQHGKYTSIGDVRKIKTLAETTVTKIGPYLSFE